jgi:Raf kinase inhibitor-like YbhB/YbcL family protein
MSRKLAALVCMLGLFLASCGSGGNPGTPAPAAGAAGQIQVSSVAFNQGAAIPQKYTCQGEDSSPSIRWSAPPAGTKSLALIMDDPDAPGGTWVHWVVYNLPPLTTELVEGASRARAATFQLPEGARQGKTSFNRTDYGGPCPPSGTHHYYFHLYALDTLLDGDGLNKAAVLKAMDGHVLAQGELMGTYSKSQ